MMFVIDGGKPGTLNRVLNVFAEKNISLDRIESRPAPTGRDNAFYVDFRGQPTDPQVSELLTALHQQCKEVNILESRKVKWFPRRVQDLDSIANEILDAGAELQSDHPGFHDKEYRERREQLAEVALNFRQ